MKTLKLIGLLILLGAVAFAGFKAGLYYSEINNEDNKVELRTIDVTSLQRKLAQVSELATIKFSYTELAKHEKDEKIWGVKLPFSTSKILIQYSGVIKAGIDLSKAKFEIEDTIVTFLLPKAQILSHDIDQKSLKVVNQQNGLFSQIDINDFNKFNIEHRDSIEAQALRSGILENAQEKAAESLSLIIDPLTADGYTVFIRQMPDSMMVGQAEIPLTVK